MSLQTVTRQDVIELAKRMPTNKLASWYEYGLFIQSRPKMTIAPKEKKEQEADLMEEFAMWEAASDEDWMTFEEILIDAEIWRMLKPPD